MPPCDNTNSVLRRIILVFYSNFGVSNEKINYLGSKHFIPIPQSRNAILSHLMTAHSYTEKIYKK